jgi:hypothetical protein
MNEDEETECLGDVLDFEPLDQIERDTGIVFVEHEDGLYEQSDLVIAGSQYDQFLQSQLKHKEETTAVHVPVTYINTNVTKPHQEHAPTQHTEQIKLSEHVYQERDRIRAFLLDLNFWNFSNQPSTIEDFFQQESYEKSKSSALPWTITGLIFVELMVLLLIPFHWMITGCLIIICTWITCSYSSWLDKILSHWAESKIQKIQQSVLLDLEQSIKQFYATHSAFLRELSHALSFIQELQLVEQGFNMWV